MLDVEDWIVQDDRATMRLLARGTHRGSLFGEAPTGRSFTEPVAWICRVAGGLVVEDWEVMDTGNLRRKLEG